MYHSTIFVVRLLLSLARTHARTRSLALFLACSLSFLLSLPLSLPHCLARSRSLSLSLSAGKLVTDLRAEVGDCIVILPAMPMECAHLPEPLRSGVCVCVCVCMFAYDMCASAGAPKLRCVSAKAAYTSSLRPHKLVA